MWVLLHPGVTVVTAHWTACIPSAPREADTARQHVGSVARPTDAPKQPSPKPRAPPWRKQRQVSSRQTLKFRIPSTTNQAAPNAATQSFSREYFTSKSIFLHSKSCKGADQVPVNWKSSRIQPQPVYPHLHPQPGTGFLLLHPWEPGRLLLQAAAVPRWGLKIATTSSFRNNPGAAAGWCLFTACFLSLFFKRQVGQF